MNIRAYKKKDHTACMEIMKSNTPDYFAKEEVNLFEQWLIAQEQGVLVFPNSEKEHYFVLEDNQDIVSCGGYILLKNAKEIYLAWGMVCRQHQRKGYGKKLLEYRMKFISENHPGRKVALTTTQNIAPFYEQYGFKTINIKPQYYSPTLDRYEMELEQTAISEPY